MSADLRPAAPRAAYRQRPARRLMVLGSAALLAGSLAVTGTAAPDGTPAKVAGGAYVSAEVVLEADGVPALPPPGMGVAAATTPVARSLPAVKAAHGDPFTGEDPVCVSYPVAPGSFRLTSPYGYRTHPIAGTYSMHMGVDFAAPLGTPIHAVGDGTVVYTGAGRLGRSSELVILEHTIADTTFYSWYVHMYPDGVFVEVGQRVAAGEVIAEVGNNGNSTGPHLHFEIHTEQAIELGNVKAPPSRRTLSAEVSPSATETPSPDPSQSSDPDPTETPSPDPSGTPGPGATETPSPDPSGTPSPDPSETPSPDPSETPSPDPSETPSPDPSETPSPDPSETPSPDPSETPSPDPSETPDPDATETPSPEPTDTPDATQEPTDEPSPEPTEEPDDEQDGAERPRHPFPTRAYGTTVEPFTFLASLGLVLVAPNQCGAQ